MGTGYTRNDTANNIADGNVINASDLDGEFDAIQSAFNGTTGHSHDGTTGEGPQIDTAGIANDAVTLGTKTSGNYVAAGAVSGVGLSGSAASEGATFTVTSNATDANTASTIVARDASGNFSAGTITAALTGNVTGNVTGSSGSTTGNAATATALQTARTIAGNSFDGTANITIASTDLSDSGSINAATLDIDVNLSLNGGNLTFNNSSTATFSGVFSGSGNLYHTGAGQLTVSGNNTYTGSTSTSGRYDLYNAYSIGSGTLYLNNGSTLLASSRGASKTISNNIIVTGTVTIDLGFGTSSDFILSGSISGTGKIVLTGDVEQIDNVYVNETSNGLAHAIENFKEYAIAGHVTFKKGERSELATLASKVL